MFLMSDIYKNHFYNATTCTCYREKVGGVKVNQNSSVLDKYSSGSDPVLDLSSLFNHKCKFKLLITCIMYCRSGMIINILITNMPSYTYSHF